MGIKNLIENGLIEVWEDVYDARVDDKAAPDLSDILRGKEDKSFYSVPEEFFKRTYMTRSMEELTEDIAETLRGGIGGGIFLLTSLFGGGKTHTQICLYHSFRNPQKLTTLSEELSAKVAEAGKPLTIVMDASRAALVPHPEEQYKAEGFTIKTIWGMLAYRLGAYAKIKHLDNEKAPAPDVDLIESILSESKEPVLILMDEIVHYVFNMEKSRILKDYGQKVLLFLDYLARAVESTPKVILVASVQAEYRVVDGQKLLMEEEIFRGYASKVLSVLSRESTRVIVPVAPDDVVKVLQRRVFEKITESETWKARDRIYEVYRQAAELFGVGSDWQYSPSEADRVITAKDTYPFHPKYVEVLQEFVTRNKDLQKTRDAIRITRKVVRRFLKGREDADFIMPWHIALKDRDIRSRVLTDSRSEFRDAVNRDIVSEEGRLGSIRECTKPLLALKIATAVLIKTYTYETFKEPLKVFPDLKNIGLMVYEPETFTSENIQPSDIETALEEMLSRLPHFTSEGERYWFTPFSLVIEHVEKRAAEMLRGPTLELYRTLSVHTKGILLRKERRRKSIIERGEVFNERNTTTIGYGDRVWGEITVKDTPSMKLVVLVKPNATEEEVRKIVLMRGGSGRRTFRNTVAVVCPPQDVDFKPLLGFAARLKAADEVMDVLSEYYTDREIRTLQERKLKRYIQDNKNLLQQQLLAALTRVAYPSRSRTEDEIRWCHTTPSSSIISQVEAGLKDPSTGPKLRTAFTFGDLTDFLRQNQNWDLVEGCGRREFKDIVNVFYTVATAPFTTLGAIERAILQGLESLSIGIKDEGVPYWKRVGPENGADTSVSNLKDTTEILPFKIAAEAIKEKLLTQSGEKKIDKTVHRVWYEVDIVGKRIKLDDLILQKGWENALKEGVILKQEETIEKGFILRAIPSSLIIEPGREAKSTVRLEPIDEYHMEVKLRVDEGKLSIKKGEPPFETDWSLGILQPGDYSYVVEAEGADGTTSRASLVVAVESPEVEVTIRKIDPTYIGAKLLYIAPRDLLSFSIALNRVSKLNLKAEANIRVDFSDNINFAGNRMDVGIAELFVQKFSDIARSLPSLGRDAKIGGMINLLEPVVLDKSKITALTPLSEKVSFGLKVERSE